MEEKKEVDFLNDIEDKVAIYQLKFEKELRDYMFEPTRRLEEQGRKVEKENYELIYVDEWKAGTSLDDIYNKFNIDHPKDYEGHSLSVSDVIVVHENNRNQCYYVDDFGFQELQDFIREQEIAVQTEKYFVSIQETDEGYDYAIYNGDYTLKDGGVYDDPDMSIRDVLNDILDDIADHKYEVIDYEELMERVDIINKIEPAEKNVKPEVEVTLTVSECSEFEMMGVRYEGIKKVDEAINLWQDIPPDRMHGIPGIGIKVHEIGTDEIEDTHFMVLTGRTVDLDMLKYYPEINENNEALGMIHELVEKLPDIDVIGELPELVNEPIEINIDELAAKVDEFIYEFDPYEYNDGIDSREEGIMQVLDDLENNDGKVVKEWLEGVIEDETEYMEEANSLLLEVKDFEKQMQEYKPLAKVEELEEENYNMIDNVLNNGAEKTIKETDKKEQEKHKQSVKERLQEKKKEVVARREKHKEAKKDLEL